LVRVGDLTPRARLDHTETDIANRDFIPFVLHKGRWATNDNAIEKEEGKQKQEADELLDVFAYIGLGACFLAVCLPGSEARHGDGCGQAIVQVIEGALVGQQEGKAIGKGCKSEKKDYLRNVSNEMEVEKTTSFAMSHSSNILFTCDGPARRKRRFDLTAFLLVNPHQSQAILVYCKRGGKIV